MATSEAQTVSGSESNTYQKTDRAMLNYIRNALRATRPWTRFLSILGFIAAVLMILSGIAMLLGRNFWPMPPDAPALMLTGTINVALSIFYLIPSVWLYRYSSAISRFLGGGGAIELGNALVYQKSFWKFVGILTLLSILLAVFGILAAIFMPALLSFRN